MAPFENLGFVWASVLCFSLAVGSAILPWVNAEMLVLSLPAVARSHAHLLGLVLVATAGHMIGKCVVYWTGRHGGTLMSKRVAHVLDAWRDRFTRQPSSPVVLVFLSSAVGIPPFYLMSVVAGALKLGFSQYLAAGTLGRLIRFAALAFIPEAAYQAFH